MNNVPQEIIKYLQDSFEDVESIILHGSRILGFAREHSDWDFIILTNTKQKQDYFRHELNGEHFEYKIHVLPILKEDVFKIFNTKLQFSKLIFDKNSKGSDLLIKAKEFYATGIPKKFLLEEFKNHRKMNRLHVIGNLRDSLDNPAMFMKKMSVIYPQIINEWYWFKKKDYPKNLYISIPQIEKEDSWFSHKLEVVYLPQYSFQDKIDSLQEIVDYIYE